MKFDASFVSRRRWLKPKSFKSFKNGFNPRKSECIGFLLRWNLTKPFKILLCFTLHKQAHETASSSTQGPTVLIRPMMLLTMFFKPDHHGHINYKINGKYGLKHYLQRNSHTNLFSEWNVMKGKTRQRVRQDSWHCRDQVDLFGIDLMRTSIKQSFNSSLNDPSVPPIFFSFRRFFCSFEKNESFIFPRKWIKASNRWSQQEKFKLKSVQKKFSVSWRR